MAKKGISRRHTQLDEAGENASRQKIISHTISILAKQGPENLSAFTVAKAAGLRRSHVVYYYPEKKDLVACAVGAVIGKGQELVLAAVAGRDTVRSCLEAYIDSLFQWLMQNPEHAAVMGILHYYGAVSADFQELNAQVRHTGEARIADILHLGKKGLPNQRERELAKLVREMLIGGLTNVLSSKSPQVLLEERAILKNAIFSLVDNYEPAAR